ncbi:multicomponent Na+:H+ antiporter subunit B [Paraburkholderia sp. Clong3]|uniref:Na(+)/H(+) antiporter subunit B n=1 Tax=unclassified Paraburkholderia TaxID=2615204 RepID=UPI0016101884|nr:MULTISPECIES: Na(+)/H(+) antiporter subunit B [unclassified Paraburkholderia]MBB5407826.1 multicomponent Na+:H+ antiporter subunit B [Paraburkholderia sp. HC6.4b]MBB5452161.1 multicomponent Na+:H+ antiporter subunit B [Paraburkholderia sp. Kb1A]MBC8724945.1 sodium:proton antiporter [Paraburkholderia sp. 31.1]MBC8728724.1 sodium:proton antiporter [Paraburkholderia sp. UCT2]MBC8735946.1 sodium:proton antiporter [Paraburkholderia sp. UCT31]
MMRRAFALLTVLLFAVVFWRLVGGYTELQALRPLAWYYVVRGPLELGAPNIVTGILITFRGFDTLGEVAVLFMVAASVGVLLKEESNATSAAAADESAPARRPAGEIVHTGKQVLLPMILTFGGYVIVNGHLSAGGGFQGGAIVASAVMLMLLARPRSTLNVALLSVVESLAGVIYVCIGILGLVLAGGFLDPRFLPRGEFGAFFSAGAIPLISTLLGVKVGAELSVIIDRFRS